MTIAYQHRQSGKGLTRLLGYSAVAVALIPILLTNSFSFNGLGVSALLFVCILLFHSLTITVTDRLLVWHFGFGVIRKQVSLSAIREVTITQTGWLDGIGIHLTKRGWLYNVSGREAVLFKMKSGKSFLLGTDDAQRLVSALEEHSEIAQD